MTKKGTSKLLCSAITSGQLVAMAIQAATALATAPSEAMLPVKVKGDTTRAIMSLQ